MRSIQSQATAANILRSTEQDEAILYATDKFRFLYPAGAALFTLDEKFQHQGDGALLHAVLEPLSNPYQFNNLFDHDYLTHYVLPKLTSTLDKRRVRSTLAFMKELDEKLPSIKIPTSGKSGRVFWHKMGRCWGVVIIVSLKSGPERDIILSMMTRVPDDKELHLKPMVLCVSNPPSLLYIGVTLTVK